MILSNRLRDQIVAAAAKAVFQPQIDAAKAKLISRCVIEFNHQGLLWATYIPAGWEKYIRTTTSVRVANWENPSTSYDDQMVQLPKTYPYLYDELDWRELSRTWPFWHDCASLHIDMKSFKVDCAAVLLACRTAKQLEETAPELAKFLPPASVTSTTALVAVETLQRVRTIVFSSALPNNEVIHG